jgi:hypothetical protein
MSGGQWEEIAAAVRAAGIRDDAPPWKRRRARPRLRRWVRDRLWAVSDRLCRHRVTFEAGHLLGELGWKLREKR